MKNNLKALLASKKRLFGSFMQLPSPEVVEIFGHSGFDFVIIDNEHAVFDAGISLQLVRAAEAVGLATVIRVPECGETYVKKALDLGASAVMCPGVKSAEDARNLVRYGKYAPQGMRGSCPGVRANRYGMGDIRYYAEANRETALILQVEGKEGISAFDDILQVEGIDGVLLGPVDLSMSLGVPGELDHPLVLQAMETMVKKARENKIAIGMFSMDPASARRWLDLGCSFIAYGIDGMMILDMAQRAVQTLHKLD